MKAFLLLFLTLTTNISIAAPKVVISQVCSFRYVEGIKIKRAAGQIFMKCLNKNKLPSSYDTHISALCADEYVEGRWAYSSNSYPYKTCIKKSRLTDIYLTYHHNHCTKGYSSDLIESYSPDDLPAIVCVRDLH